MPTMSKIFSNHLRMAEDAVIVTLRYFDRAQEVNRLNETFGHCLAHNFHSRKNGHQQLACIIYSLLQLLDYLTILTKMLQ